MTITTTATRRVLVADDDSAICTVLTMNLEAEGFHVVCVDNGEDAREVARRMIPDLVVLDVMMPGRDGLDVLAALKANPATRDVPVVLLSARASDDDIWKGWQAGADYYLTKPFNLDELMHFIEELVSAQTAVV